MTDGPNDDPGLLATVHAAQRVAGVLAARQRGDLAGAQVLLGELEQEDLAAGALLLSELSLGLYARESGQDIATCISTLCIDLERAVRAA